MEVDECESSPCGNGGTCIVSEPTNQGGHGQDCPIQLCRMILEHSIAYVLMAGLHPPVQRKLTNVSSTTV